MEFFELKKNQDLWYTKNIFGFQCEKNMFIYILKLSLYLMKPDLVEMKVI